MRRMYSEKGIYDTVNKGIQEGEISAGGLPEIEESDAGKVLKVNNAGDGVEWGSGLPEIESGDAGKVLKVNDAENGVEWSGGNILTLDFNNTRSLTVSTEIATAIRNADYNEVHILNYYATTSAAQSNKLIFRKGIVDKLSYDSQINIASGYESNKYIFASRAPVASTPSGFSGYVYNTYIKANVKNVDFYLKIQNNVVSIANGNTQTLLEINAFNIDLTAGATTTTGTITLSYVDSNGYNITAGIEHKTLWHDLRFMVSDVDNNASIYLTYYQMLHASTVADARIIYYGELINVTTGEVTNKYILQLKLDKTYTLTKI